MYTYLTNRDPVSHQARLAQRLVVAVGIASALLAIRVVGSVVFYFGQRMDMNPVTGSLGVRVGLYLVPEVLAACALLGGGLGARHVRWAAVGEVEAGHKFGSRGS